MELSEADLPTIDRLLVETVARRDLSAAMDLDVQWDRYAHTITVLTELRDEITGGDDRG